MHNLSRLLRFNLIEDKCIAVSPVFVTSMRKHLVELVFEEIVVFDVLAVEERLDSHLALCRASHVRQLAGHWHGRLQLSLHYHDLSAFIEQQIFIRQV